MKPEWCEWQSSRVELQELLPECEKVFHLFLEYFYTGKILITHTNVLPILALADKYIVKVINHLLSIIMNYTRPFGQFQSLLNWGFLRQLENMFLTADVQNVAKFQNHKLAETFEVWQHHTVQKTWL